MVLAPEFIDFSIKSRDVLIHVLHLFGFSLAAGPVIVMQDISPTGHQLLKLILDPDALPEVVAEEPGGLLLNSDCYEV
jgi:hypothetical protein